MLDVLATIAAQHKPGRISIYTMPPFESCGLAAGAYSIEDETTSREVVLLTNNHFSHVPRGLNLMAPKFVSALGLPSVTHCRSFLWHGFLSRNMLPVWQFGDACKSRGS